MNTFKITNITNTLGKREYRYNSIIEFDYVDNMMNKKISIKPGDITYLTISSLPLSVHRLRINKLITVMEISAKELNYIIKESKPKNNIPKSESVSDNNSKLDIVNNKSITKTSNKKSGNVEKQQSLDDL